MDVCNVYSSCAFNTIFEIDHAYGTILQYFFLPFLSCFLPFLLSSWLMIFRWQLGQPGGQMLHPVLGLNLGSQILSLLHYRWTTVTVLFAFESYMQKHRLRKITHDLTKENDLGHSLDLWSGSLEGFLDLEDSDPFYSSWIKVLESSEYFTKMGYLRVEQPL